MRCFFFLKSSGDPRYLHVLTHPFPPLRSSDLLRDMAFDHLAGQKPAPATAEPIPESEQHGRPVHTVENRAIRSEEHTSELQSLMRISYAVFCLIQKKLNHNSTYASMSYDPYMQPSQHYT